jgi:hypothetical protein
MKFHETHFEDYILSNKRENIHPKLEKIFNKFPSKIHDMKNVIFYGPHGIGKYTQMLRILKRFSPTDLKYEKKISIPFNKQQYFFKISDIHYEVDMSLLGCNSKLLWHEIYQNIIDILSAKVDKVGVIVCKNFQDIHSELLDNFYSYMQQNETNQVLLHFFIITQEISFIPDNILNCCEIISIPRPSKTLYNKCLKNKLPTDFKLETISNIKNLHLPRDTNQLMQNYKIICDKIIGTMVQKEPIQFLKFRALLYDLLIYNLNTTECVWYIVSKLLEDKILVQKELGPLLLKTYSFFQFYNNNYRPIYHLENYFYYLVSLIHKYE